MPPLDVAGGIIQGVTLKATSGVTWKLDEPKTAGSRRAVPIPAETPRALQRLKARNAAEPRFQRVLEESRAELTRAGMPKSQPG